MQRMGRASFMFWGCISLLQACVTPSSSTDTKDTELQPVTVMSWNVENLFDTDHDEGKNDWTFLPLDKKDDKVRQACKETALRDKYYKECISRDWNETALKAKMERIATVILSQNQGRGADLVFLCEIENIRILDRLRQDYLQAADYKAPILLEGPDERGIDCAFLTRLTIDGSPALHPITLSPPKDTSERMEKSTRAILQADFKLPGGERLTALAIHFPAGFHPTEHRREALAKLNAVAQAAAEKSQVVVAAGDFNINYKEAEELYQNTAAKDWQVSHLVGCKDCPGSYFFDGDKRWSFFDAIMVYNKGAPAAQHTWKMDPASIRIVNDNIIQRRKAGPPQRFYIDKDGEPHGVSDHYPVWMQLTTHP